MKVIVTQTGARRGYAVPKTLAGAGMLERFYTDICGNVGLGRVLTRAKGLPVLGEPLIRLANRQLPAEVLPYTRTFEIPWMWSSLRSGCARTDPESRFRQQLETSRIWAERMTEAGFGEATHVYSMLSEGGTFLRAARKAELRVIAEVYILISTENILENERKHFPEWEPGQPNWPELRRRLDKENHLFNNVDDYICPSEAVRDDLVENWGVGKDRCQVVPYGMSSHWLNIEPNPVPGRVLFVGTADLRKGIHYLAQAAEILEQRGRHYEIRIAGHVSEQVSRQAICRHLTFLGRVPRDQIHGEFQCADVFVLPSLAEGSAEVTYEALGAGIPQVVTNAAGSVARDGIEGCVVPERDSVALADAIEQIIEDRTLRDRMAGAARERARDFTWERYGERLLAALANLEI